jgi:DNA replication and repair protein RecF
LELSLGAGVTVVSGNNGHGKTNLLEAIHWVTQGWSFRTRSFESAVRFGADEAWLRMEGTTHGGRPHRQGMMWRSGELSVKVGVQESKSLSALHGNIYAILLGPEDIEIVKDGPERRRRWIDLLLCQRYPEGLDLLQRYRRILAQRNRFLKDHRGQSATQIVDLPTLEVLTEQLGVLGAAVMVRREALIHELQGEVSRYYAQLSDQAESIEMEYQGSVHMDAEPELAAKLVRKMNAMRTLEFAQGITAAGPQKDELLIRFSGNRASLREAGSQGQCRTTALAMGLVAVDVALGLDSEPPILLLDDIFAELDSVRRSSLAALIRDKQCQVLVATPRAEDLPFHADARLFVAAGKVVQ